MAVVLMVFGYRWCAYWWLKIDLIHSSQAINLLIYAHLFCWTVYLIILWVQYIDFLQCIFLTLSQFLKLFCYLVEFRVFLCIFVHIHMFVSTKFLITFFAFSMWLFFNKFSKFDIVYIFWNVALIALITWRKIVLNISPIVNILLNK